MSDAKQRAVQLIASGKKLTSEQLAKELGVTRRTITAWKAEKEFKAALKTARNAWRPKARNEGPADKDWRLRSANDLVIRMRALILQRAKDPQMQHVPGGKTGLLTVTYKMQSMGEGLGSEAKPEYRFDTAVVESILSAQEHIAITKGEWQEKVQHSGSLDVNVLMERLNAGRKRVADEKQQREASEQAPQSA